MTPLLAPPCGAPNPALCLRVSNTEQATLLLVCRARREGPERCGRSDVPAPRPGQRDHGPLTCHGSLSELHTHGLSSAPPEGGQPGPQRLQGQCPEPRPSTAVSAVDGTRRDPVGRGAAPAPPCAVPALARGLGGGPLSLPPTPLRPGGRWGRGGEASPPFLLGPAPRSPLLVQLQDKTVLASLGGEFTQTKVR